jgi:ABC-type lipoprotein export system ATPase subunit
MGVIFQNFLLIEELSPLANASITTGFAPIAAREGIRRTATAMLTKLRLGAQSRPPEARLRRCWLP